MSATERKVCVWMPAATPPLYPFVHLYRYRQWIPWRVHRPSCRALKTELLARLKKRQKEYLMSHCPFCGNEMIEG